MRDLKERENENEKILLANKKLKENVAAEAYTFAIRTSRHTSLKLQKSMFLSNARVKTTE